MKFKLRINPAHERLKLRIFFFETGHEDMDYFLTEFGSEIRMFPCPLCVGEIPGLSEAEVISISTGSRITAAVLEQLPRLKMICSRGGFQNIDLAACRSRKITVCSTSELPARSVLENGALLSPPAIATPDSQELRAEVRRATARNIREFMRGAPLNAA